MVVRERGFSLIELMIATAILTMVMYVGYLGYSLYSQAWEKRVNSYWQNSKFSIGLEALVRVIESSAVYIVDTSNKGNPVLFFEGRERELLFISSSPIYSATDAIIKLIVKDTNNGIELIYKEKSLAKSPLLSWPEGDIEWENEVVLLPNLIDFKLSYLGYENFKRAETTYSEENVQMNAAALSLSWQKIFTKDVHKIIPEKVNVSLLTSSNEKTDITIDLPAHTVIHLINYLREEQ